MAHPILDEEQEAILRVIRTWPLERQQAFARIIDDPILTTLDPTTHLPAVPSSALRGIGSGGKPAPSDEEVARWLDAYKMGKYGR